MTKFIISFVLILPYSSLIAQTINYCDYFSMEVTQEEFNGKIVMYYSPEIHNTKRDQFGKFLRHHENRFSYLLLNKVDSLGEIAAIYPDTVELSRRFCQSIINKNNRHEYFIDLSPRSIVTWKAKHTMFTLDQMMLVASRFFYVDKINSRDTTVERKICVGINGQTEQQFQEDMTLLEAFTFEAIFYSLLKNNTPQFESNFDDCISRQLQENKKAYKTLEELENSIRDECYSQMAKDEDLKFKLIRYYKRNKNNLNFEITETGI